MQYFRCAEMANGRGWRCPNCSKLLMVKARGNMLVQLVCQRCKAFISIRLKEPITWGQEEDTTMKEASVS